MYGIVSILTKGKCKNGYEGKLVKKNGFTDDTTNNSCTAAVLIYSLFLFPQTHYFDLFETSLTVHWKVFFSTIL